jgi:group I intron endonuclease
LRRFDLIDFSNPINNSGVYQIRNKVNGKLYIGSSVNLKRRKTAHFSELKRGIHHSGKLQNSYNKYGADSFVFEVILVCQPCDVLLYEQIILDFKQTVKNGYNVSPTAGNTTGHKKTPEQIEACRERQRGVTPSAETRQLFSENMKRRMSDPVERERATRGIRGRIRSKEEIEKMIATKAENMKNSTDEDKQKRSDAVRRAWIKRRANKENMEGAKVQSTDIFSRISPGDLIVVSHKDWKTLSDVESQVVRIATESEFSHVCVVTEIRDGVPYVIEAVVPCVVVSPVTKYLKDGFYHIAIPDKPMSKDERDYGLSKVGQKYSKVQAVEGYLHMLDIGQDTSWQCSELTIAMRRMSGINLGPIATPAAVVQTALSKGYNLTFIGRD